MKDSRLGTRTWSERGVRALLYSTLLLLLGLGYVGRIHIDDAFITYRYAANLSEHGKLLYNLTGDSAFATTAPGYALLLALLNRLGADIPLAGALLGAAAIGLAAWSLAEFLAPLPRPAGLLAGLLLLVSPLLWLVLGMEGLISLALVLAALALGSRARDRYAALLLAGATLLRFDAAAAAAIWGLWLLTRRGGRALPLILLYGGVVALVYGALMWTLGVPLPSTLGSKQAQQTLGISGFFPDTSWLDGILLLVRAFHNQSPLYLGSTLLALLALCAMIKALRRDRSRRTRQLPSPYLPLLLLLLWALAHVALYVLLGVTPYLWYYLPLAVLASAFTAYGVVVLGMGQMGQRKLSPRVRRLLPGIAALLALTAPALSHLAMQERLGASADLARPGLESKILPEAKDEPYREAGRWLAANVPEGAMIGVTEVGILGYYSHRPMIDFLGLLDRDVAAALGRGDLSWGLYARQPAYLVLPDINPIYGFDVYKDRWFQGAFEPIHTVPGNGFWGGDLTIYRRLVSPPRQGPIEALPPEAHPLSIRFGEAIELVGIRMPEGPWEPHQAVGTTFFWRVLEKPEEDYVMFVHLVDDLGRIVSARDGAPLLGALPTSAWAAGSLLADFHPLGLPPLPQAPAQLRYEIGFYRADGTRLPAYDATGAPLPGDQAYIDARTLLPAVHPLRMGQEENPDRPAIVLPRYEVPDWQLSQGGNMPIRLEVSDCACPIDLTLELWDEQGQAPFWQGTVTVEQAGTVELLVQPGAEAPLGWRELRLRARQGERELFWLDDGGHPVQPVVPLTSLYLVP